MILGKCIRHIRKTVGLNQERLSKNSGISTEAITSLETTSCGNIRTMMSVCRSLGIEIYLKGVDNMLYKVDYE